MVSANVDSRYRDVCNPDKTTSWHERERPLVDETAEKSGPNSQAGFTATHSPRPPLRGPQRDRMEVAFLCRSNRRRRNRLFQRSPTKSHLSASSRIGDLMSGAGRDTAASMSRD